MPVPVKTLNFKGCLIFLMIKHEVTHIKTLDRIMYRRVLLLVGKVTLKPLKRNNKDGRSLKHFDLLEGLLMRFTLATIPFILPRQLLRPIEQSKTIIDGDLVRI